MNKKAGFMDKKKLKDRTRLDKKNMDLEKKLLETEEGFVEMKLELESARKKQKNLLSIINSIDDIFFILGLDGAFIRYCQSPEKVKLFLNSDKFLGEHFSDVFPSDVSKKIQKSINEIEECNKPSFFEYSMNIQGKENVFEAKISKFDSMGGKFFGFIFGIKNITESRRKEELLVKNEQKYKAIFSQSTEYVFLADIDTRRILESNKAVQNLLGYTQDEIKDLTIYDFFMVNEEDIYQKILDVLKKHSYFIGERKLRRKSGNLVDVEISVSIISFSGEKALCFVARDITPRKLAQEQLYHAATHDRLTGLKNRLLFYDMMGKELARARRNKYMTALIYIDLDYFKRINDTKGHSIGDKLLVAVGARLNTLKRDSDILARMGGDEFIVLLSDIKDEKDVSKKAHGILFGLQRSFEVEGYRLEITASVGYSIFPKDGTSPETLIKSSDIAMYFAKTHGRNRCERYSPDLKKELDHI
jgi:diguanylate cyclase (GGDEF)-like protein/PAS domain S-box-containing protein